MDEKVFYNRYYKAKTRWWRGLRDLIRVSEHMIKNHVLATIKTQQLPRDARILDLGCGRGQLTRHLAGFGKVLGIDYSQSAIEFCAAAYPHIHFETGDVFEDGWLDPKTEAYDLVVATEVIEHIVRDRQRDFVQRCVKMCTNGGLLVLTTPCRETVDMMRTDFTISEEAYYQRHEGQPIANLLFTHQLVELVPQGCEVLSRETLAPFIKPRVLDLFWKGLSMPTDYRLLHWVQRAFGYHGRVQAICVRVRN